MRTRAPATWFHVVGLGNQEPRFDGGPIPGTGLVDGYQIWVTRADGIIVPGDCDLDGSADYVDLGILATHYDQAAGAAWGLGDFDENGSVDYVDLGLMASNYDYGPGGAAGAVPIPEPAGVIFLLLGLAPAAGRMRRRR